jgi:TolA-binding protein
MLRVLFLLSVIVAVLSFERVSFGMDRLQYSKEIEKTIEYLESSLDSVIGDLEFYEFVLNSRDKKNGIYDEFFEAKERVPPIENEFRIKFLVRAINEQRNLKLKLQDYLLELGNLKLIGSDPSQSNEAILFATSQVFEKMVKDRFNFLFNRKKQLVGQVKDKCQNPSTCQVVLTVSLLGFGYQWQGYVAQQVTDQFVDRESVLVLLFPYVRDVYLSSDARTILAIDSYLEDLLSGKITSYKSPDEALSSFQDEFNFPPSAVPQFEAPNRAKRRTLRKTIETEKKKLKKSYDHYIQSRFEKASSRFYEHIQEYTTDDQLDRFGWMDSRFRDLVQKTPKLLLGMDRFRRQIRYFYANAGMLDFADYYIAQFDEQKAEALKLRMKQEKEEKKRAKANSKTQENRKLIHEYPSVVPARTSVSSHGDPVQESDASEEEKESEAESETVVKGPKRKHLSHPEHYRRPENSTRLNNRAERQREYLKREELNARNPIPPVILEAEASEELSGEELSKDTVEFMRNLFRLGEYKKTGRNLSHFWEEFLKAYANIKWVKEKVPHAKPDSSRGNGSVRTLTSANGHSRNVHEVHGSGHFVENRLANRIQRIFELFGWTPEAFGIQE